MSVKLIVTVLGIGLIVWVNWYFLFSKKKDPRSEIRR
jgi:plastocyanin domain-containing protein